jgi:hypothetical protein
MLITGLVTINPLWLIGIIPLTTALAGWCPLYASFGLSTCKKDVPPWHSKILL